MTAPIRTDPDQWVEEVLSAIEMHERRACEAQLHTCASGGSIEPACSAEAVYVITGLDAECDLKVSKATCHEHLMMIVEMILNGQWCSVCSRHSGHALTMLEVNSIA